MSYEFKGTPGPWSLGTENDFCADIQIGDTVASVNRAHQFADKYVISRDAMLANAHLIAAAPELLAAAISALDTLGHNDSNYAVGEGNIKDACILLQQAIEKALNIKTSHP